MEKWVINQRFPITNRGWIFIFEGFPFNDSIKIGTRFIDQNSRVFEVTGIEVFGNMQNSYYQDGIRYGKSVGVLFKPIGSYDKNDPVTELTIEKTVSI